VGRLLSSETGLPFGLLKLFAIKNELSFFNVEGKKLLRPVLEESKQNSQYFKKI